MHAYILCKYCIGFKGDGPTKPIKDGQLVSTKKDLVEE